MKTADLLKTTISAVRREANGTRFNGYSPRKFAITLLKREYAIELGANSPPAIVIDAMQGILKFNNHPTEESAMK